uniref:G_PROTEIN_RECEP_F1_2 domain-containing protein n=1 Tax=Caenorhabditis japonica TaxID=281687 RepID=A0A8R1DV69_CAEJA
MCFLREEKYGPITLAAAALSAVGTVFAVRFLQRGHLNRGMSAALYTLCLMDFMLMMTTVLFLSIESMSMLFLDYNAFYEHQSMILTLYGIRNSFAMSSPMLVCYITYTRYRVVNNPLKFASNFSRTRKSISVNKMNTIQNTSEAAKFTISFPSEMLSDFHSRSNTGKMGVNFKRFFRPFLVPILLVVFCFAIHITSYYEFFLIDCFNRPYSTVSTMLHPTELRNNYWYFQFKVALTMATETVGPMLFISILSLFTEYKIHANVLARRRLFESQKRSRDTLVTEELKDKASKALAVFIVVKFLILRSLPTFIDLYEVLIGDNNNFSLFMSVLTRVSDFLVILNSATNTLAYFGKVRFEKWLERRIRCRIVKKEAKEMLNNSLTG